MVLSQFRSGFCYKMSYEIQLTLKQHRFEVCRSIFIFNIYSELQYPQVSHPWIQPTAGLKQYFQSTVGNPQVHRANSMHCRYAILYKRHEHPQIWYMQESWDQFPMDTKACLSFWRVKIYMKIINCIEFSSLKLCVV